MPADDRGHRVFQLLLLNRIGLRRRFAYFSSGVKDALIALAHLLEFRLIHLLPRAAAALDDVRRPLPIQRHFLRQRRRADFRLALHPLLDLPRPNRRVNDVEVLRPAHSITSTCHA